MAIFKNTNKYFSAVDSRVIRNRLLSLPALGMLAAFLDRSDTWQFRTGEISRSLGLSADETEKTLSELVRKGFALERRDLYGVYYDIYAYPAQGVLPAVPEQKRDPPAAPVQPNTEEPDPPEMQDGAPMTDEQREKWSTYIREHFPVTVKAHDLNEAIRTR